MTIVEINKRLYPFPQKWNELTGKQLRQVFKMLCSMPDEVQAYLQLLRILSGCSWFSFFREKKARLMEYFYLCDFIFSGSDLTTNLIPEYKGTHGPASNFDNLRMNEFAYSQNYFELYRDDETNLEALNKLVATLYRYGGGKWSESDLRQPFKEAVMLRQAEKVKHWPEYIKHAIFTWYAGCVAQLMNDNADVFTGGGGEPALHGIVSVMRNVAKEGTYGDFEKVELMYVKMFFLELKESKHEAAQMEKNK